ncbi:hypothetical protein [Paenibacillus sedimenti]|uniref:DUF4386 domain-containing protein n=1 Tax=Paenibacillus sedimenti TaxID=2770274 RepID=A0A926KPY9_9BACL|nr:hypothetical protein [Paenibacillus sedimenti]MBD0381765.1 hypothetical protein [Paenibacillus sedimenti]
MKQTNESSVLKMLSRWSLLPVLFTVCLIATMSVVLGNAGDAPEMIAIFYGGLENPALIRVLGFVIVGLWISIGGFLLLFACQLMRTDQPKAIILAVLGLGVSVAGTLGGFHQLTIQSDLIARYTEASAAVQAILIEQVPGVLQTVEAHLETAELFSYLGFFVFAWSLGSISAIPSWFRVYAWGLNIVEFASLLLRMGGVEMPFITFPLFVALDLTFNVSASVIFFKWAKKETVQIQQAVRMESAS